MMSQRPIMRGSGRWSHLSLPNSSSTCSERRPSYAPRLLSVRSGVATTWPQEGEVVIEGEAEENVGVGSESCSATISEVSHAKQITVVRSRAQGSAHHRKEGRDPKILRIASSA
jgi:hypothetical protein